MKVTIGHDGYIPLKTSVQKLKVIDIRETVWEGIGPALEWLFEVDSGSHKGCQLKALMNRGNSLGPKSKFGRWYHAITGLWLKKGDVIDTDILKGRLCLAKVTFRFSKKGKPSNEVDLIPTEVLNDANA